MSLFFFFVSNVKLYVKHSHLRSLNIFCNPLLENIFQDKCLIVYEWISYSLLDKGKEKEKYDTLA